MTTIAAPKRLISSAFFKKASAPSLREMEFTMHLPWAFLRPARTASQWEESIIRAALATAGSPEMWRRKVSISLGASSMASSMLMSMTPAPPSICWAATCRASSYCPAAIRRANLREPATLVRSPMLVKLFCGSTVTTSNPLTLRRFSLAGTARGARPETREAMARICSGVVPQQPPIILTYGSMDSTEAAISFGPRV